MTGKSWVIIEAFTLFAPRINSHCNMSSLKAHPPRGSPIPLPPFDWSNTSKMGSKHNRKRTRSRPRNRKRRPSPLTQSTSTFSPSSYSPRSTSYWQQPSLQLQERIKVQRVCQQQQANACENYERAMEAERVRMFGGEAGDEVSLCAPMLDVVMTLFNGNVDYEDPWRTTQILDTLHSAISFCIQSPIAAKLQCSFISFRL